VYIGNIKKGDAAKLGLRFEANEKHFQSLINIFNQNWYVTLEYRDIEIKKLYLDTF